jgi:hypothetical protein
MLASSSSSSSSSPPPSSVAVLHLAQGSRELPKGISSLIGF